MSRGLRFLGAALVALLPAFLTAQAQLPTRPDSLKFAVVANQGDGSDDQKETAKRLGDLHERFPFDLVLLTGDNLIGSQRPHDYIEKFETPYKPLIDAHVTFRTALGPKDPEMHTHYKLFNMNGQRYYTFKSHDAQFFAIDNTTMAAQHLDWLARELDASTGSWRIAYFYGTPDPVLERVLREHKATVMVSGGEAAYSHDLDRPGMPARFVLQANGKSRNILLGEIAGDRLFFNVANSTGAVVDSGVISKGQAQATSTRVARRRRSQIPMTPQP